MLWFFLHTTYFSAYNPLMETLLVHSVLQTYGAFSTLAICVTAACAKYCPLNVRGRNHLQSSGQGKYYLPKVEGFHLQKRVLISGCSFSECHMYLSNNDTTTNRSSVPSVCIKWEVASFSVWTRSSSMPGFLVYIYINKYSQPLCYLITSTIFI